MKQKPPTQDISRKDAAQLLADVMQRLASEKDQDCETPALHRAFTEQLEDLFKKAGLKLPKPCTGEAHSNPYVDNCGICLLSGKWGWSGKPVKVK